MEECVATRNATLIIKRTLARAKRVPQGIGLKQPVANDQGVERGPTWIDFDPSNAANLFASDGLGENAEGIAADNPELDWLNTSFPVDDGHQALFWAEWAHRLEGLGA
jgi:hypothetical protein